MRTAEQEQRDLVVLVADNQQKRTVATLLTRRPRSLDIQEMPIDIDSDILSHPKELLDAVLRRNKKRRSAALYQQLAERVSLETCEDGSFRRFREILQGWFPA